jgi:hypothetical protein
MALTYNNNNTISYADDDTNMTMFVTSNKDSSGNLLWNVKGSDDNLITSTNFSYGEAFQNIQKDKNFNPKVGNELISLGL